MDRWHLDAIYYIKIERRGTRDLHTVCPTKLRSFHYINIYRKENYNTKIYFFK